MASVSKRGDGWRARYREWPGGPQRSRTFRRKVDAERWLVEVQHQLARGEYFDPKQGQRTVLDGYAREWMASQPWRQSSRERWESLWRVHVAPTFGARPVSSIRQSHVQSWATGLRAALGPEAVKAAVRLLRAVLQAAVDDRLIAASPAVRVRLERQMGELRTPLTVDEVRALADAIVPELRAAVILAGTAGIRQGELFGLTEDRVHWLKREIVVDRQLVTPGRGRPALGPCKTARSVRVVPVPDDLVAELASHRERFGVGDVGFLFHNHGSPWARQRGSDVMRAASKAAGVPATWHALRHHAASVLIAEGLSVTAVASVLGHSPSECLKTYAAWWPDEHERVRSAMARAWAAEAIVRPASL